MFFLFVFLILLFSFFVEFRFLQLWTRVSVCFFKSVLIFYHRNIYQRFGLIFFRQFSAPDARNLVGLFFKNFFIIILSERLLTFRFLSFFRWFYEWLQTRNLGQFQKNGVFHNFTEMFINVSLFLFYRNWLLQISGYFTYSF